MYAVSILQKTAMCHWYWEGFGPSRRTLKPDAVPTIFTFSSPLKCKKFNEARQANVVSSLKAFSRVTSISFKLQIYECKPKFMDIYLEPIILRDISTQADMFLAVLSPKQSSPVPTPEVTTIFGDEGLI